MPSTTFAQTAVLSQRQRATLNALSAFPQGAQVSEIAASLGLHVNTVRGHLEELVTKKSGSYRSPAEYGQRSSRVDVPCHQCDPRNSGTGISLPYFTVNSAY
ncbi:helix-turn-helix domain-containing protein [Corynebacterium diphtheriae bv. gravis]|nr:helix-turn-helix domain-containing protein [Corynebacterium diphtheriae bv. gravis]UWE86948.1 helix-turn-helix domain-containing protein [Corynebacterium diphtheriae bv. gravis]UWF10243.1 helix-turn-helix domain-containing protein [Corynebacterium diphtheriae bv. gravis]